LPEDHAQHLVPTGKAPYVFIAAVLLDDAVEDPARQELGKLGEHIFVLVHGFLLQKSDFRFKSSRYEKSPQARYTKNFKERILIFSTH
tara:strand:+ start:1037 stop:1300 length:264 start_codon:yes stop_codon:yes gene_type:complete